MAAACFRRQQYQAGACAWRQKWSTGIIQSTFNPAGTMSEAITPIGKVMYAGPLRVLAREQAETEVVAGWVRTMHEGSLVCLQVNGCEVLTTQCSRNAPRGETPPPGTCWFSFRCDELAELLGNGDIITIIHDGKLLQFPDGSEQLRCSIDRRSRSSDLFARLDGGETFNKFGKLVPPTDAAHAEEAVRLYRNVAALLAQEGLTVFPCYGTLLGIIREGRLLKQDSKGFDAVCLMPSNDPQSVRRGFIDVCELLVKAGYFINPNPDGVYVRDAKSRSAFVDLHYGWFRNDCLQLSYGWYHEPARSRAEFLKARTARLLEMEIRVPGNAEAVLEQIYGEGWRIPDQGFTHDAGARHVKTEYLLDADSLLALYKLTVNRTRRRVAMLDEMINALKVNLPPERRLMLRILDAARMIRTLLRAGYHRLP